MKKRNKRLGAHTSSTVIFIALRVIVFAILLLNIWQLNFENVFTCVLTLILFTAPFVLEEKFKIEIPSTLEIVIFLFIFSAQILGEINSFYTLIPYWDTVLHTINGFIMGAVGFSMIELLNESDKVSFKLSPIFIALTAFCFSMTIGVFWEFFEFGMDQFFGMDMQKDTIVSQINSVTFDPDHLNNVHTVDIDSVVINGETWEYGGYIDIGLIDTMKDLIVNFIGAFCFSLLGYFYSKSKRKDRLKRLLIVPRREST